jgi:hypothetical protein
LLFSSNVVLDFPISLIFIVSLLSDFYSYYFIFIFFQIINAPFLEEAEDTKEDKESPNSLAVVEVDVDEIPLTSGFDSQMT